MDLGLALLDRSVIPERQEFLCRSRRDTGRVLRLEFRLALLDRSVIPEGDCISVQEQAQDKERLEAKGKTTDIRALRVSAVRETWPRLAEAFEAKRAADAAKEAGKAARAAAALDKATASMAARLQAFLQPRAVSAPAKAVAGVPAVPAHS